MTSGCAWTARRTGRTTDSPHFCRRVEGVQQLAADLAYFLDSQLAELDLRLYLYLGLGLPEPDLPAGLSPRRPSHATIRLLYVTEGLRRQAPKLQSRRSTNRLGKLSKPQVGPVGRQGVEP